MPLNVIEEEVDKVILIQVQAQIIYVHSIHFAFKGQLSNLINLRYSLHENPILFPLKIEQL